MAKKKNLNSLVPLELPGLILGLDLSLTATGWATVFPCDPPCVENYGLIASKLTGLPRLDEILNRIKEIAGNLDPVGSYLPTALVVLEDFAYSRGNQAHQIGELQGIIRMFLWNAGFPMVIVAPTQLKKFITGRGNADKSIMLKELYKRFAIDIDDDNIGDAVGLLLIGKALTGMLPLTTDFQREVLKGLSVTPPKSLDTKPNQLS